MSVVYILLPLGLVGAAAAVWAFVWATRTGQFDDLDTPALRILHDDEEGEGGGAPEEPRSTGRRAADPARERHRDPSP